MHEVHLRNILRILGGQPCKVFGSAGLKHRLSGQFGTALICQRQALWLLSPGNQLWPMHIFAGNALQTGTSSKSAQGLSLVASRLKIANMQASSVNLQPCVWQKDVIMLVEQGKC